MIKIILLIHRHPDLTHEEFADYWKSKHAPLFAALPEAKQYVRRYVQDHAVGMPQGFPPSPVQYDGVAEIWFDDMASLTKLFTSANYLEKVRPDEMRFCDLSRCAYLVARENVVLEVGEEISLQEHHQ